MSLVPFPDPTSENDETQSDADELDSSGGKMSFLEHLDELRNRLITSVVALLVGFLVAFLFTWPTGIPGWPVSPVFEFIMRPLQEILPNGGRLVYTEPAEAFLLYIKIAALAGLILAIPVVLYQLWRFVAPGLYAREKRFAIPFVLFASIFFVTGALFSHYLLFPWAWRFFAGFTTDYMEFFPRIQPAFSLYVKLVLACGLVFQMPTLVFFLARVGAVTPRFLINNTKYAILFIFIFAAVLTPTGDPVTLTMMAAPMIALYGLSIVIAWVFRRRGDD